MTDRRGQRVGNYRLLHLLGKGGFAEVYLGQHIYLGSQAAIKILHTRVADRDIAQFQQEGRMLANLYHSSIVRILDFGIDESQTPYLVMDYAPGGTLRTRHPKGTRLPLPTIVDYVKQIAQALQYAHDQHFIHRDIKPENILTGRNSELLLSDFGIAIIQSSLHQNREDMAGTIAYMAPEQIQGNPQRASDQYALAIVVYEWLCGHLPFCGSFTEICAQHVSAAPPSLRAEQPTIPPEIERVVLTALEKDPKGRFASIQAFVTALEQASRDSQIEPQTQLVLPKPSASSPMPPALSFFAGKTLQRHQIDQTLLSTQPMRRKHRQLITSIVLLVVAFTLLFMGAGGYAYSSYVQKQATATAVAQGVATATAKVAPTATIKAARDAYNMHVIQHGIMFGFDTHHTHTNLYECILNVGNIYGLHQIWVAATRARIYSSPVVVNGIVYIGSEDKNLYAFDAETGKQKWVFSTNGMIYSSPAIVNGVVYVGNLDSKLYAVDALTGELKWVTPTGGDIFSSPTVADGVVYVGSMDRKLYTFDAVTGKPGWVAATSGRITASPAVTSTTIYVYAGVNHYELYAIDRATGVLKWRQPTGHIHDKYIYDSSPTMVNGIVYVGAHDYNLYAFDAITGERKWIAPTGSDIISSPAVANGTVYVGSLDGKLYAFDAETGGNPKWIARTDDWIKSTPTIANGVVYIGSNDHHIYAFNAITGERKWIAPTDGAIFSSPTVANGVVYVGSEDGNLYAFSL